MRVQRALEFFAARLALSQGGDEGRELADAGNRFDQALDRAVLGCELTGKPFYGGSVAGWRQFGLARTRVTARVLLSAGNPAAACAREPELNCLMIPTE